MKIEDGQTILFTGDSITDCGRGRPVGRDAGLGNGYVSLVNSTISASRPDHNIEILNTGVSGDRVIDLDARWQTDVLDIDRGWLSIMIGINDVWRQFDSPDDPDQVDIERYESTYRALLEQVRPSLKGLVLMTPYFIEPDLSDPMRAQMDRYSALILILAKEFDAVFVDVQAAFDRYLVHRPSSSLCGDRIHPNQTGHTIIANAFLAAIDFDGQAGNCGT